MAWHVMSYFTVLDPLASPFWDFISFITLSCLFPVLFDNYFMNSLSSRLSSSMLHTLLKSLKNIFLLSTFRNICLIILCKRSVEEDSISSESP